MNFLKLRFKAHYISSNECRQRFFVEPESKHRVWLRSRQHYFGGESEEAFGFLGESGSDNASNEYWQLRKILERPLNFLLRFASKAGDKYWHKLSEGNPPSAPER